jgi:hypothetical protein
VDAMRQSDGVSVVLRARDDSIMRMALPMQLFEIGMVMGKHSAPIGNRISKNVRVGYALVGSASLLHRPYIVAKSAQFLNDWQRNILIRIQSRHLG